MIAARSPAGSDRVTFAAMTEAEIDEYARSGEHLDKAGAYGIQGLASRYVTDIEGDYFNVVGLPVSLVYKRMLELGWTPKELQDEDLPTVAADPF